MLHKIAKKVFHSHKRQWYGYLTPSEFLILHRELKLRCNQSMVDRSKQAKSLGKSNPRFYYFELTEQQKKSLFK